MPPVYCMLELFLVHFKSWMEVYRWNIISTDPLVHMYQLSFVIKLLYTGSVHVRVHVTYSSSPHHPLIRVHSCVLCHCQRFEELDVMSYNYGMIEIQL